MKYRRELPTQDRLKQLFDYKDGFLLNKKQRGKSKKGEPIGFVNFYGYRVSRVDMEKFYVHRLIWVFHNGSLNDLDVDHIDGNRDNNKIDNLRLVNSQKNNQNIRQARKTNALGVLGVSMKFGKFCAQISFNRKVKHLGLFNTVEEAHQAYLEAKRKIHEGCLI
jgi:poly-beta-hydroxyalkanoate depolymerase